MVGHGMVNAQYTPEEARAMEDALIALTGPTGPQKLPRPKNPSGNDMARLEEAERKRLLILSLATDEWQRTGEIATRLDFPVAGIRSSVDRLINDGRLEGRKFSGKIHVRLPQEETT